MNRADRRRYAKEVAKGNIGLFTQPQSRLVPKEIVAGNGKRYTDVEKYLNDMERDTAEQCSEIASKMLYESEVYMSVANILTMLYAMDMVVGNLKTVQKSYQRILDHFNDASEYIDQIGIREAFNEFQDKYGVQLNFDDADLNWIDDGGQEVYRRFRLRIGEKKKR